MLERIKNNELLKGLSFSFLGGGLGAISRCILMQENGIFGLFLCNIIGTFVLFFIFGIAKDNTCLKHFFSTGIAGGLTSFSAFSFFNFLFLQKGAYFLFLGNILFGIFSCFISAFIALKLASFINRRSKYGK